MYRCVYHPVPWHTQLVAKRDQSWVTGHFKVHSQTEVGRTATCGTGKCHSYWVLADRWCWWGDQDQIWLSQVYEETVAVSESVPRH